MNFNIVQKSDGTGNWTSSTDDLKALGQLVAWANGYFQLSGCSPTDPCPGTVYPTDSHIQLSLENIYFYQDNNLWASNDPGTLLAAAAAAHPDALQQLNVFFTGGTYGSASALALTPSYDRSYDQAVVMLNASSSNSTILNFASAGTLVHELGHVFGLLHTYSGGCCPETGTASDCAYLDDVFCPPTNPYPQDAGWGCDPTLPATANTCTNNMMGGVQDACLFSAQQLGRAHQSLSATSAQKYVKPTVCSPSPPGMVLWLPFDELHGTIALNPPGVPGSQIGNPTRVAGEAKGALRFDGASQYVDVPSYPAVNFGRSNFTIEAWVMPESGGGTIQVIAEKRSQVALLFYGFSFFLYNGQLGLQLADGGYSNFVSTSTVPIDGHWHHVAVTVIRNQATGGTFFIDGSPDVASFDPRSRKLSLNSSAVFRVGSDTLASPSSFFNGSIDEVVAYSRALGVVEIQAVFAAQGNRCKRACVTPGVRFALNQAAVTVNGQICNDTALPQAFMYWYEVTPAATCAAPPAIDGPVTFGSCSAFITVPPGTCVMVPTQVQRPPGFNNNGNNICYQLAVQSLGDDDVANFRCSGVLADYLPLNR